MLYKRFSGAFVCFLLFCISASAAEKQKGIERFALYVGANNGGSEQTLLRYAGTDAMYISKTMSEIGGISPSNSVVLVDPLKDDIDSALENLSKRIAESAVNAKRTEFLFYYSGHSDENALLLGSERYDYSGLKTAISDVPSDVHIVMLDSCFSGSFIRAKSGARQKSFLQDDSSVVKGHAYLSSSSETESSQESDALQGSYFTHSLVTGLRGAADISGDNKVSLNELYYYAHNDTLARTEKSVIGPQHPSYNITLVGSGDLIISDISDADSLIYLPTEFAGRFFIRNKDGNLVSEVNKTAGSKLPLAIESGRYTVTMVNGSSVSAANISVKAGENYTVPAKAFYKVSRTVGRARGGSLEQEYIAATGADLEEVETEPQDTNSSAPRRSPFAFSIVPQVSFQSPYPENVNISLGLLGACDKNISGIQATSIIGIADNLAGLQASGFMNIVNRESKGIQIAGFMNIANTGFKGTQAAGFMNFAGSGFKGEQAAGFMNIANTGFKGTQAAGFMNFAGSESKGLQASGFMNIAGKMSGLQIGIINIADENKGVSLGIFNFIKNGIISPGVVVDVNGTVYLQYQGGTPYFFTTYMFSGDSTSFFFAGGIGTQLRLGRIFSFDFELLWKQVLPYDKEALARIFDDLENPFRIECIREGVPSLRATFNVRFAKRFAIGIMGTLDFEASDYNSSSFDYRYFSDMKWSITDSYSLHPSASIVFKI